MHWSVVLLCLFVLVSAKLREEEDVESSEEDAERRCPRHCQGPGYECVRGKCYCTDGYIPNPFHNRCVRCPVLGEHCYGSCCSSDSDAIPICYMGVCSVCRDANDNWICHSDVDNIFLVSSTQIAMATALILGILATFVLLYKLCAATSLRPYGAGRSNIDGRLSVGSLQLYVEERLRDAPPRYSRTAPNTPTAIPATIYLNSGFIHDSSLPPPPPYTLPKEENQNHSHSSVHI